MAKTRRFNKSVLTSYSLVVVTKSTLRSFTGFDHDEDESSSTIFLSLRLFATIHSSPPCFCD